MSIPQPHAIGDKAYAERDLVVRVRAGDATAFEGIFKQHYMQLCEFVGSYVEAADAEELVQEVFCAIWRRRETWSPDGGVRAYLFAAVRNGALSAIRRKRVAARAAERCTDEGWTPAAGERTRDPASSASVAEAATACRAVISGLPEGRRLAMMLRWTYGMSHAEIAFVLDTSVKGVEIQLARGLKTLSAELNAFRL
jgi:RNA polymerase sigma-70 factor (ECF subfamily)